MITSNSSEFYPIVIGFLIVLNIKHHKLYKALINKKFNVDGVFAELSKMSDKLDKFCREPVGVKVWVELIFATNSEDAVEFKLGELLDKKENEKLSNNEKELIENRYNELSKSKINSFNYFRYIKKNIELASQFK